MWEEEGRGGWKFRERAHSQYSPNPLWIICEEEEHEEEEGERARADDTVQNPYKCEKKTRSVELHGGERLNGLQVYHRPAHNSKVYGHSINRSLAPIPCSKHYRKPHVETGLKTVCTDHYLVSLTWGNFRRKTSHDGEEEIFHTIHVSESHSIIEHSTVGSAWWLLRTLPSSKHNVTIQEVRERLVCQAFAVSSPRTHTHALALRWHRRSWWERDWTLIDTK